MKDFLNQEERDFLLKLARDTIEGFLKKKGRPAPGDVPKSLYEKRGAFVTLKVDGQLRGCIGRPLPDDPLLETVIEMALAAATKDSRFPPIKAKELGRLKIEISVLTIPQRIRDIKEIEIGRHGIIISKGFDRGLLLPQVPTEYGWNLDTYLGHGCLKAGLDEDEWRKGATIEVFEAQVFSE